jgi:hypothetical protein
METWVPQPAWYAVMWGDREDSEPLGEQKFAALSAAKSFFRRTKAVYPQHLVALVEFRQIIPVNIPVLGEETTQ